MATDSDALREARRRALVRRRRLLAAGALVVVLAVATGLVFASLGGDASRGALVPREQVLAAGDPLAYDDADAAALERAAADALSHPLYAKSPGGVTATARRTAEFRPLVEESVAGSSFDADLVEAIVFLESGGRPDVIAGDDPARASGLTQILAETAQSFLGLKVDLAESRRLTRAITVATGRGDTAEADRLRARRRAIDERFDPERALAGTVRYLETARERVGRDDLAVVSYHMGIGNLAGVLRAYAGVGSDPPLPELVGDRKLSWARIFFDTTPSHHAAAYRLLARLSDGSPNYYWRVLAAKEIMRLFRDDPERLAELDALQNAKASAEEVLHPPTETERFLKAADLERAWQDHTLQRLPDDPARFWLSVDSTMGELASQLGQPQALYQGLRPEALAQLLYIAARVHSLSGSNKPLEVTSTVRDDAYQRLLRTGNPEATRGYSLHTTGYAFDIRRRYASRAQAEAFQFVLETLNARGLITWVREPSAIHVTVSSSAAALVPFMLAPERS